MSDTSASLNPPAAQIKPEKLADHSLHDVLFAQANCNLPRNLAVTLGFQAPPGTGPTPGQTTTGVAQAIPEQSDTGHQSISTESPLIDTAQRQNRTHPVSQDSFSEIVAARTLTVKTAQSPPSRIPIPAGSESLETHTESAAGAIGSAVSRMRASPHGIHLQVLIVSLGTTDVPVRETNHATEENSQTSTHNSKQSTDDDRDRVRTTEERIYGVGITAAVSKPTTQSARQARLSPDRTAARVLAPFGTKRSETGFITVARDPADIRERLEKPDTRPFGTGLWSVIQASKIAPTDMLQRHVSMSGRPGMPRVCESDLSWFIGGNNPTHAGPSHGTK